MLTVTASDLINTAEGQGGESGDAISIGFPCFATLRGDLETISEF